MIVQINSFRSLQEHKVGYGTQDCAASFLCLPNIFLRLHATVNIKRYAPESDHFSVPMVKNRSKVGFNPNRAPVFSRPTTLNKAFFAAVYHSLGFASRSLTFLLVRNKPEPKTGWLREKFFGGVTQYLLDVIADESRLSLVRF